MTELRIMDLYGDVEIDNVDNNGDDPYDQVHADKLILLMKIMLMLMMKLMIMVMIMLMKISMKMIRWRR